MVMPVFLLAFLVVTTAFVSTLWNAGQVAVARGEQRFAHMAIVGLMIAILAMLGLGAPEMPIRILAATMLFTSIWLRFNKGGCPLAVCASQATFGVIVLAGLPFTLA